MIVELWTNNKELQLANMEVLYLLVTATCLAVCVHIVSAQLSTGWTPYY